MPKSTGQKPNPEKKKEEIIPEENMLEQEAAHPDNYMRGKSLIIGKNIRQERKARKFSVENMAEFLELSISYIGLLERGDRCPSLKIVYKLCELFGITPDDLLLESEADFAKLHVAEDKNVYLKYKIDALTSFLAAMNETELDFVISVVKNLKKVER